MASRRKRTEYHHVSDDEWFSVAMRSRKNKEQCCDCGLVHRVSYRIVDGRVEWKASVDARATAAARRVFRYQNKHG